MNQILRKEIYRRAKEKETDTYIVYINRQASTMRQKTSWNGSEPNLLEISPKEIGQDRFYVRPGKPSKPSKPSKPRKPSKPSKLK